MAKPKGYSITDHHSGGKLAKLRVNGKYVPKVFPTYAAAEQWCLDQRAKLRVGTVHYGSLPFGPIIPKWIEEKRRRGDKPKHCNQVLAILNAAAKAIPDIGAEDAKSQAKKWLDEVAKSAAPITVNYYLITLNACVNWLVEDEVLPRNPFKTIKGPKVPKSVKPVFTIDECRQMLAQTDHTYHPRFVLGLYFGLRSKIDSNWEIRGDVMLVRGGKGEKDRIIPLRIAAEAIEMGWVTKPLPPLTHKNNGAGLRRMAAKAGVQRSGQTPHSLRHTWCAALCATGENIAMIRDVAGHERLETTDRYSRLAAMFPEAREWPRGELRFLTGWASPLPVRTTEKQKISSATNRSNATPER